MVRVSARRVWCGARGVGDDVIFGEVVGRSTRAERGARGRQDESRPRRAAVSRSLEQVQSAVQVGVEAVIKVRLALATHDRPEVKDGDRSIRSTD